MNPSTVMDLRVIKFPTDLTATNAAGCATAGPVAYVVDGMEYIANPFGGSPSENNCPLGDAIIAFTLPK